MNDDQNNSKFQDIELNQREIKLDFEEENQILNQKKDNDDSEMSTGRSSNVFSIEDVVRPTGKQIQKGFKYFDLTVKFEKLLYELHSFLYWSSLVEFSCMVLSIMMFFKFTSQLSIVLMFIPHLFRGIVGMMLDKKLPRSHNIINDMTFGHVQHGKITFDAVQQSARDSIVRQSGQSFEDAQSHLRMYFGFSILCAAFDFIVLCYAMSEFGATGKAETEMILLGLCCPLLFADLFWLSFYFQLKYDLPPYISQYVLDALRGSTIEISKQTRQAMVKGAKQGAKKGLQKSKQLGQKIAEKRRNRQSGNDGGADTGQVIEPRDSNRQDQQQV